MKEVFIVTAGEYSGYGIVAVFSREEDANAYVARLKRKGDYYYSSATVEPWDVDDRVEIAHNPLLRFSVHFQDDKKPWVDGSVHRDLGVEVGEYSISREKFIRVTVDAKDKDHALKVASDRLAQFRAGIHGIS